MIEDQMSTAEYYLRVLSPAVLLFSIIWLSTVLHRYLSLSKSAPSSSRPHSPDSSSLVAVKRHKIRNEFIARPGAAPIIAGEWQSVGYRGWIIMASLLLLAYVGRQFYKNLKRFGSLFSTRGSSFLYRIFVSELFEFVTAILVIYFFSFFAFVVEKAKLRFPGFKRLLHATAHFSMLGFLAVVTWYLLERRYEVSISFRFAVAAHAFVQYMKMVSYLGTNENLSAMVNGKKKCDNESVTKAQVSKMILDQIQQALAHRGIDLGEAKIVPGSSLEECGRKVLLDLVELDEYRSRIYPNNVSLMNFIEFSCLPVLVYEPKYPRASRIDYHIVIEKLVMIAGIILVEWFLMEHFIVPSIVTLVLEKDPTYSVVEAMLDLAVPLQLFVVLLFYLVFECILGANAELMRLADRMTYADWWNSTTFEEFSRKWNKPVHEFLLRHIHIEAQNSLGLSRRVATIATFLYSIVAHEIILLAMFGIFRPYLGFFSLFQIPLWFIMRSPLFQTRVFGNIVFWSCLTIAWPLMCVLYCREYCLQADGNCRIF